MKTPFFLLFSLLIAIDFVSAQDIDSSLYAPLSVTVTDFNGNAQAGETILFEGETNGKSYEAITNAKGKFHLAIKGGETYLIKIKSVGDDLDYTSFEIPELPEGKVYSSSLLSIQFDLPKSYTLDNVQFEFAKATLTKESYIELNELIEYLRLKPNLLIEIAGHTDDIGSEESNYELSKARARAVKLYLYSQGIPKHQVSSKGYGASRPIADNSTGEGRRLNRRTEVIILND